jgi:hypothetical protein
LLDSELWLCEKFTRGQAWVDLFALANHRNASVWLRGIEVRVRRGQIALSESKLAQRWGWSRNKVRRFLKWLKTEQQIEQHKTNVTSLITIINYELHQSNDTASDTASDTAERHQKDTRKTPEPCEPFVSDSSQAPKNVKNVKNVKNKDIKKIYKRKNQSDQTPVPSFFPITEQMRKYAEQKNYVADLEDLTEAFLLHHKSKGSFFSCWYSAWQKWLRNQLDWHPEKNVPKEQRPGYPGIPVLNLQPQTYAQAKDAEQRALAKMALELRKKNDERRRKESENNAKGSNFPENA